MTKRNKLEGALAGQGQDRHSGTTLGMWRCAYGGRTHAGRLLESVAVKVAVGTKHRCKTEFWNTPPFMLQPRARRASIGY